MSGLALALERAWYAPPRLLWLLYPLELLFAAVTAARRWLFRRGILTSVHPGVPVVVVGNITVGGTGKTPVVIALARALAERGERVAVVSRGYGGTVKGVLPVSAASDPLEAGDEAVLIARATQLPVYVGADRVAAARMACVQGASLIVCDDGLQHYRLRRDVEIVTMDAQQGAGNGHLLPVGPLRESRRRLAGVDFLLQRNGSDPGTALHYRPAGFRRLAGDECRSVEAPGFGPRVHAVAAIARPERFFATLRDLGLEPVEHPLRDHAAIDGRLLAGLQDLPLVMTSKDAVKGVPGRHADSWILEMDVAFPTGFLDAVGRRLEQARGGH